MPLSPHEQFKQKETKVMYRVLLALAIMMALEVRFAPAQEKEAEAGKAEKADSPTIEQPPTDPFQPKPDPGANEAEDEAKKYPELAEAQKLYAARDVKGALDLLEQAAKKYKELPPPKVMLAAVHFRNNNAVNAKAALDEAVRDDPTHPEPYLMLADLAIREGRFTEATLLMEKAVANTAAFKGDADKLKTLKGRCYAALVPIDQRWKDWARAKADLDKWLALEPDNAVALYRMGEVLFHQDQRKAAYEKLQEAHKKNKSLPNPATVMGTLFLAAEDKEQAKKWMNFAADQAGEDTNLKLGVARWHWVQNNIDDARKQADAVLESDPHSVDGKYLRGVIAFYEQDYDNAKRQFESLLLQQQNHLGGNLHLALALLEQNTEASRQAAVEMADRMLVAAPTNASVVATAGWIYYRTGKHEKAERLFANLGAQNLSLEAAYYIAKIQADRDKKDEAKKLLEVIVKNEQPFIYAKAAQTLLDRLEE
jgi:Tfp pilus assembly protein PilF